MANVFDRRLFSIGICLVLLFLLIIGKVCKVPDKERVVKGAGDNLCWCDFKIPNGSSVTVKGIKTNT